MTDAEKADFVAALAELKALKPGPAITRLQFDAWWNALRGKWTLADFRGACARLRDEHEFMPNPYHFEQLRKSLFDTAGEMWARALTHAANLQVRGGFLQETLTGDPVLDAAARAVGGFKAIASAGTESLQFIERRFCERLEEIRDANTNRRALPDLTEEVRSIAGPQSATKLLGTIAPDVIGERH